MIRVACATCGEFFEVGEEFAGLPEFCPACGALNDIPETEIPDPEPSADAAPELVAAAPPASPPVPIPAAGERGVPSPIWWGLIIGGPVCFVVACLFLLSDNWESGHLQALSDASNRGDVLMIDENYAGAAAQYRAVIDTVGGHRIDSIFIRQLIDHSVRGEADAEAHLRAGPTTAPQAIASTAPATQPGADIHEALTAFQRDSEGFARFVRDRPIVFRDGKGNWRRRKFTVWEVTYERQADSDPPRMQLDYSCGSRVTEPHDDRSAAEADDSFVNDESPRTLHIRTTFELRSGEWTVLRHEVEAAADSTPGLTARPSLDDFYDMERRREFGANAG